MRFFDISATALAAATMLSGASAAVAPPAYEPASLSSTATTTYYVTRTVLRVVETVTATGNGTTSTYATTASSTASTTLTAAYYGSGNKTTITGSNSLPSATYVSPPPSTGSAGKLEALSFVAALGLVGLVL